MNILLVGDVVPDENLDRLHIGLMRRKPEWTTRKVITSQAAIEDISRHAPDIIAAALTDETDYGDLFSAALVHATHALRFAFYPATTPTPPSVSRAHQVLALRSEIEPLIPVFAAASEVAERVRKNPVLANIIANLEDVPSPPVLYFDLREQVENESGDLDTMADIAARDPSLVARILKVANSGFYSLPRSVSDLSQALGLIGTDGLLGMVLAAHLYAGLPPPGLKLELLWQHTLRVSALAREIARIEGSDRRVQSQCAVAGLLHDIGILVLLENEPERYQPIWKRSGGDETILAELERAEFGVTHGELGALILMLWSLPEDVVEAVRHSHSVCPIENPAPSVVVKSVLAAEWLLDNQADEKLPSSLLDLDAGNLATWVEERDIINNQHLAV